MRDRRRLLLLVALAALLAGCGGEEEQGDPIPGDVAAAIASQLDAIGSRVEAEEPGACEDIEQNDDSGTFAEIERQLASLPAGVDADVEDALRQSVDRLRELVNDRCAEIATEPEPEPEPEPTETLEAPTITEEEEPPPETIPEETVPEELPPGLQKKLDEPVTPPDNGPGNSGGAAPVPGEDG